MKEIKFRPLRLNKKTNKIIVASYMQWNKLRCANYLEFKLTVENLFVCQPCTNTNVGRRCGQIYKTIKLKVMGYFSWKEDEAYREGRNDYSYGRRNYDYDEHLGGDADKAYYDGRRDEEREEEQCREMYEEERRQEERQERKQQEHRQYMRDLEEQEYLRDANEQQQYPKQEYPSDDLPF